MSLRRNGYYQLSFQQEEEMRRYSGTPDCAACCSSVLLYQFAEDVDTTCLSLAIEDLVKRHAALRTTIEILASGYAQHVHPEPLHPSSADIVSADSVEMLTSQLARQRIGIDAIMNSGPLFRAELHQVAGCALLSIRIHHLVYDGWSLSLIFRDLAECYAARLAKRPAVLPPTLMSYGEFSDGQRKSWNTLRNLAVPFWSSVVSGYPGTVHWPSPSPDLTESLHPARTHRLVLPAECMSEALGLARAAGVSPFTVLLSVTGIAITRVTQQRDLLVGTQYANREDPNLRDTVGFFSNIRITRLNLANAWSLTDLVVSVRNAWRTAEQYRDANSDPVLQALGRPEFIKIDLVTDRKGVYELELSGVQVREIPVTTSDPYHRKFTVRWASEESGYAADIIYQPTLINDSVAAEIADHIVGILRSPARAL
jgi:Condensation domain